ncbi:hypothetical protein ACJX0J_033133 [Zea mays]
MYIWGLLLYSQITVTLDDMAVTIYNMYILYDLDLFEFLPSQKGQHPQAANSSLVSVLILDILFSGILMIMGDCALSCHSDGWASEGESKLKVVFLMARGGISLKLPHDLLLIGLCDGTGLYEHLTTFFHMKTLLHWNFILHIYKLILMDI